MLYWAFVFLVIGLVAALFGFTGVAGASFGIAKILAGLFLVVFLILLIVGMGAAQENERSGGFGPRISSQRHLDRVTALSLLTCNPRDSESHFLRLAVMFDTFAGYAGETPHHSGGSRRTGDDRLAFEGPTEGPGRDRHFCDL